MGKADENQLRSVIKRSELIYVSAYLLRGGLRAGATGFLPL